jgi:hypothetical protein
MAQSYLVDHRGLRNVVLEDYRTNQPFHLRIRTKNLVDQADKKKTV